MESPIVKSWFVDRFKDLAPEPQALHLKGGRLGGTVRIEYGNGLARMIGQRLAQKMNFPGEGAHSLNIRISHDEDALYWARRFNQGQEVVSLFKPAGCLPSGYWVESSGPLEMRLTVDVVDGAWSWRCLAIKWRGLPVPQWLMPTTRAYKRITADGYQFHVSFSYPLLGKLLSYEGTLRLL